MDAWRVAVATMFLLTAVLTVFYIQKDSRQPRWVCKSEIVRGHVERNCLRLRDPNEVPLMSGQ